jgi:hypothetical protein
VQSRAVFCERSDGRPVEDRLDHSHKRDLHSAWTVCLLYLVATLWITSNLYIRLWQLNVRGSSFFCRKSAFVISLDTHVLQTKIFWWQNYSIGEMIFFISFLNIVSLRNTHIWNVKTMQSHRSLCCTSEKLANVCQTT